MDKKNPFVVRIFIFNQKNAEEAKKTQQTACEILCFRARSPLALSIFSPFLAREFSARCCEA